MVFIYNFLENYRGFQFRVLDECHIRMGLRETFDTLYLLALPPKKVITDKTKPTFN